MNLILASGSIFRRQILTKHGIQFDTLTTDFDEQSIRSTDPEALTLALAQAKAIEAVKILEGSNRKACIIAADQVVCWNGNVTEKPQSAQEVRDRLNAYPHAEQLETVSAIHVWNMYNGKDKGGVERTPFTISYFTESEIELVAADPLTFKTCGGLPSGIPNSLVCDLVERHKLYNYNYVDSINGLPMNLLRTLCDYVGFDLKAMEGANLLFGKNNANMA